MHAVRLPGYLCGAGEPCDGIGSAIFTYRDSLGGFRFGGKRRLLGEKPLVGRQFLADLLGCSNEVLQRCDGFVVAAGL